MYKIKETIQKLTDEEFNHIAEKMNKLPHHKISLTQVFKAAVMKKPSLIFDVMRVFAGF